MLKLEAGKRLLLFFLEVLGPSLLHLLLFHFVFLCLDKVVQPRVLPAAYREVCIVSDLEFEAVPLELAHQYEHGAHDRRLAAEVEAPVVYEILPGRFDLFPLVLLEVLPSPLRGFPAPSILEYVCIKQRP